MIIMNIVFLDIDGVLQPHFSNYGFNANKKIIETLSNKYNIDYHQYDFYDVAAVYYDWDEQSICRLKYILDKTNSKIIISSNWRNNELPNKMKDLLAIQGLDSYWFADNINLDNQENSTMAKNKSMEIRDSLNRYSIDNFVVLDDWQELLEYFPDNCVITNNAISIDDMNKCIRILKR